MRGTPNSRMNSDFYFLPFLLLYFLIFVGMSLYNKKKTKEEDIFFTFFPYIIYYKFLSILFPLPLLEGTLLIRGSQTHTHT